MAALSTALRSCCNEMHKRSAQSSLVPCRTSGKDCIAGDILASTSLMASSHILGIGAVYCFQLSRVAVLRSWHSSRLLPSIHPCSGLTCLLSCRVSIGRCLTWIPSFVLAEHMTRTTSAGADDLLNRPGAEHGRGCLQGCLRRDLEAGRQCARWVPSVEHHYLLPSSI